MKLGTQTGSLVNHILGSSAQNDPPQVGMAATILHWTDRSPATIVEVNHAKRYIVLQDDMFERIDKNGLSESQAYVYRPDPDGHKTYWRKMKDGRWAQHHLNPTTGRLNAYKGGPGLVIGYRERHWDPHF